MADGLLARLRTRSPAMQPGSRRLALLACAVCLLPLLLQLPGPLGIGLGALAVLVMAASRQQPMPALLRFLLGLAGLATVALTMPGVGRDTACGVLALMLALKPSETFTQRDGRSLVGFALFAPFATFLLDQGPLSLGLGLAAALLGLATLQRLALEEAQVPALDELPTWRRHADVPRLVGLGLPLALAAFWLFPRIPTPMWGAPDRSVARPGLSDSMSPGAWRNLLTDDSAAARVQFFGPEPTPEQMYWRGPVLWRFDGRSWTRPATLRHLPAAELQPADAGWDYQIELEPTERSELVALDLPVAAPEGATLAIDFSLYAGRQLNGVSRWRMRSVPPRAAEPLLRSALRRLALELPEGYNPRTLALGREWRAEAGRDAEGRADEAIVNRALAMIRADFAYTLDVPLSGINEVDDFLFRRRQGYCEHFSSAFTVLMRAAGIPARVVTGYAGGYRNPMGGYWLLRNSDAHAWSEVWLPRRGWVRVDPTAAVAPENIYDTIADRRPGLIGGFAGLAPVFDLGDFLRRGWNDFLLGYDASTQQRLLGLIGFGKAGARLLTLLFAIVAALALAWMAWLIARGERERNPLLRAWHRLGRRYARLGRGREPHEPARQWAERVAADVPAAGEHLLALSQRFSTARYAAPGSEDIRALLRDLASHRP